MSHLTTFKNNSLIWSSLLLVSLSNWYVIDNTKGKQAKAANTINVFK